MKIRSEDRDNCLSFVITTRKPRGGEADLHEGVSFQRDQRESPLNRIKIILCLQYDSNLYYVAILGSIHLCIGSNQISQPDQTSFGSNWSSLCFWNDPNPLRNVEAVATCQNQKKCSQQNQSILPHFS